MTGVTSLDVDHLGQLLPAVFDLLDLGHVGHRAAGRQVGQDDGHALAAARGQLLRPVGQDVGRLGHEVDAAEGDRPALLVGRGQGAELIAVAAQVRQGDHFVLLVVMAEDQQLAAQGGADLLDPRGQFRVFERFVGLKLVGGHRPIENAAHGTISQRGRETQGERCPPSK